MSKKITDQEFQELQISIEEAKDIKSILMKLFFTFSKKTTILRL